MSSWLPDLEEKGYFILENVFSTRVCATVTNQLDRILGDDQGGSALRAGGGIYGARNLLKLLPPIAQFWQQPALVQVLAAILGPQFGLVRVLFFDKPPGLSWSLPWHKDLTVAIKSHHPELGSFKNPTTKAGVSHAEAPEDLLRTMVNVRVHLDDISDENGPLCVLPSSHRNGKQMPERFDPIVPICVHRGDVLVMRPLLAHCSKEAHPDSTRHRRILHFEFAPFPSLPGGYAWHDFVPPVTMASKE